MTAVIPDWQTVIAALDAVSDGTPAIQTHANRITFAGDLVYKVKRPVTLPFLDYGTVEIRRDLVEKEIAYNQVTALDLYLGRSVVLPDGNIVDDPSDVLYQTGEPLVRMRRFPADALLAQRRDLPHGLLERLARDVAIQHRESARIREGAKPLDRLVGDVVSEFRLFAASGQRLGLEPRVVETLAGRLDDEVNDVETLFESRRTGGVFRRCHGDLHLQNIAEIDGVPVPFDCIEFSDGLSHIDPYYDLAFLLMDLRHRGFGSGASRVLSAYLTVAAETAEEEAEVYEGLRLLPLYLALRAVIRAYVEARIATETQDASRMAGAGRYAVEAIDFLRREPLRLTGIGGISATGKSSVAFGLAPRHGRGTGAVVIRSDACRKRLYGSGQLDRLPPAAYAEEWTNRTFAEMRRLAGLCLRAGTNVIADAVHGTAAQRQTLEKVAMDGGAEFDSFWLEIDVETAVDRARAREKQANDVSDAGEDVVRRMAAGLVPPGPEWRRVDAGRPLLEVLDDAANRQNQANRQGRDDGDTKGAGQEQ